MVKDIQYVTDAEGRRTSVLLPIAEYEALQELAEDAHLARIARESKNEPTRPLSELVAAMRAAGEIDV